LVLAALLAPETLPKDARSEHSHEKNLTEAVKGFLYNLKPSANGGREILKAQVLFAMVLFAGDGIVLSTLTLLLKDRLGETISLPGSFVGVATLSGMLFAMRAVLAAIASPLMGRLSDRRFGRVPVLITSLAVALISYGALGVARTLAGILPAVILSALSTSAIIVTLMAYLGDHAGDERRGAVMGQFALAGDLGSMVGPALAFFLIPLVGISAVYGISVLVFLTGIIILVKK
jgi:MFS family permease